MQQCPKCGSGAPEDAKKCAICLYDFSQSEPQEKAPEAAQQTPTPNPASDSASGTATEAQSSMARLSAPGGPAKIAEIHSDVAPTPSRPGVEVRRTLGGDYYEVDIASPVFDSPPNASGRPGGPPPQRNTSGNKAPARRNSSIHARPAADESGQSGGNKTFIVMSIILVLALAVGGGGYWYWQNLHSPSGAATKWMTAMKNKEFKTVVDMMEWPEAIKTRFPDMAVFNTNVQKGLEASAAKSVVKDFSITGVENQKDDSCVVKILVTAGAAGSGGTEKSNTKELSLPFIKVKDEWKVDVAHFNPAGLSTQ